MNLKSQKLLIPLIMSIILSISFSYFMINPIDKNEVGEKKENISIQFLGDFMIGDAYTGNYEYPFEKIKNLLKNKDENILNLETSITDYSKIQHINKSYLYKMDSSVLETLVKNNIHVCNLANNHFLDYGSVGLYDTLDNLTNYDIYSFGGGSNESQARKGLVKKYKDTKIAYLGYFQDRTIYETDYNFYAKKNKFGVARLNSTNMREDINRLKRKSDLIFVSLHIGKNYDIKINELSISYARYAIDIGADAVIIHSPHIILPFEIYKGKPIFYSLGNFIFTTPGRFYEVHQVYQTGISVEFQIYNKNITKIKITPFKTNNKIINFQPYLLPTDEAIEVFNLLIPPEIKYELDASSAIINLSNSEKTSYLA